MTNQALGELIRHRRHEKRWTQEDLAKVFAVSKAAISGWELGKYRPGDVRLVSRVLAISIDDLVR